MQPVRVTAIIACVITLFAATGCPGVAPGTARDAAPPETEAATTADDWPRTFTDDLGAEVTPLAPARRVVSISPGLTEAIFAIGAEDRLVGRSDFCYYPPEALEIPSVGQLIDPSIERIVGLEPDLVLVIRGTPRETIDSLRSAGVPVIAHSLSSLEDVIETVRELGRYLGEEEAADAVAEGLTARMKAVEERTERVLAEAGAQRPSVLFTVQVDPVFVAGEGSFVDDMIEIAGGRNAVAEMGGGQLSPWPQISLEAVVEADPDIVAAAFEGHVDEGVDPLAVLRTRTGWQELTAVREGRVYALDPDLTTRAGPRLLDGLEAMAEITHSVVLEAAEDG